MINRNKMSNKKPSKKMRKKWMLKTKLKVKNKKVFKDNLSSKNLTKGQNMNLSLTSTKKSLKV